MSSDIFEGYPVCICGEECFGSGKIWIDKNGKETPIKDLTTGHLDNIVKYLYKLQSEHEYELDCCIEYLEERMGAIEKELAKRIKKCTKSSLKRQKK
jgi:hypothetical protein